MAPETSQFESSEMLATFLASTPLLEKSWRLCSRANANTAADQQGFVAERVGRTAVVAFSGVQSGLESCSDLVELEAVGKEIFGSFCCRADGDDAVRVHGGLLQLFLAFHGGQCFRLQELLNDCKSVIFSGHGVGGAVASLSALWLLSYLQRSSVSISIPVFCITFGAPMLGNESFSEAILQERWDGNFCHVVAQYDIVPRLFLAPSSRFIPRIFSVLRLMQLSMTHTNLSRLACKFSNEENDVLFNEVFASIDARLRLGKDQGKHLYWPFGSYMFCTEKGAICLDNSRAIVKFLHSILATGSGNSCIEDHLKYGDYIGRVCTQCLQNISFEAAHFPKSNSEAGIELALQSSGLSSQEPVYEATLICLLKARQLGWRRNLNNAKMAVSLSKITPFRAELEWYKTHCDDSNDQLGYYDSFKRRGASRRDFKVNMNMRKLGCFWDDLIEKMQKNQLPPDFHKQPKYVNASHFYKLLVEPLEIADYYKEGKHLTKGHYIEHGRHKRFKIFDKWWGDRKVGDEERKPRSKYASLTQDSCFWARVEEAWDYVIKFTGETDPGRRSLLLDKIERFEQYANGMIDRMEVSIDVLAKNSSYNLFREEWNGLKSQQHVLTTHFEGFQDGI